MKLPHFLQKTNNRLVLVTPSLIKRKPLFLVRAFIRDYLSKTGNKYPLRSVLFHTHYKCNMYCVHCYEKNFIRNSDRPLSIDEKKQVLSQCIKLGALSVDFVSGESALDPELPELIESCHPPSTYITLATNGFDMPLERIQKFHQIGVDKLNISLDSWFAEEHNRIRRNQHAYGRVFETIESCKEIGMGYHLTVFVYKNSTQTEGFRKLVEYSIKNKIRTTFKAAVPLGAWESNLDQLITDSDRNTLFDLHREYPFLVRTCIATPNSTCPGFNKIITVTAFGDILPCNAIHVSFGNIRKKNIEDILRKGREVHYFNGTFKGCPPAEDPDFIKQYLSRTFDSNPYPIEAEKVFSADEVSIT